MMENEIYMREEVKKEDDIQLDDSDLALEDEAEEVNNESDSDTK